MIILSRLYRLLKGYMHFEFLKIIPNWIPRVWVNLQQLTVCESTAVNIIEIL